MRACVRARVRACVCVHVCACVRARARCMLYQDIDMLCTYMCLYVVYSMRVCVCGGVRPSLLCSLAAGQRVHYCTLYHQHTHSHLALHLAHPTQEAAGEGDIKGPQGEPKGATARCRGLATCKPLCYPPCTQVEEPCRRAEQQGGITPLSVVHSSILRDSGFKDGLVRQAAPFLSG